MNVQRFEDIQAEFLRRVSQSVYCTMATIDRQNRPRSRIMHPIWEGPNGWVISSPTSHKAKHLACNPWVSLAYIADKENPVYVDGAAEWVETRKEKERIWRLHKEVLSPPGFDPEPHYGSIDHPYYGLLCITPWRIELAELGGESMIWRP